jgi:hypothetical protein
VNVIPREALTELLRRRTEPPSEGKGLWRRLFGR